MKKIVSLLLIVCLLSVTSIISFASSIGIISISDPKLNKSISVSYDYASKKIVWSSYSKATYYKVSARNTTTDKLYLDKKTTTKTSVSQPVYDLSEGKNYIKVWIGAYNSNNEMIAQNTVTYTLNQKPTVFVLFDEDAVNIAGTCYGHLGMAFLSGDKWYYFSNNGVDKTFADNHGGADIWATLGNQGPSSFTFCELDPSCLDRYEKFIAIEDSMFLSNFLLMDINSLSPQKDIYEVLKSNCATYVLKLLVQANCSIPSRKYNKMINFDAPKDIFPELAKTYGVDIQNIDIEDLNDSIKQLDY